MKADVAIVGGGAIGVCCALELARRGAQVTLYERGPVLAAGCSAGNAGLICPSHSNPISNPTSLRNGLRWMWKRDSPFYLRPRPDVLPWLARFALAARHSEAGAEVIRELSDASLELHAVLGSELGTSFERTGTLNVYETHEGVEAEARHAARSGLQFEVFDEAGTRELEPALIGPVAGSVRYPREGRVDPVRFVETIGRAAADAGVDIRTDADVRSLDELKAETVVVAAGAWSKELVRLPLEGGKGYHIDFEPSDDDPRMPSWIQETWTIATPLPPLEAWPAGTATPGVKAGPPSASPGRLRLSGTLELAGLDLSISTRRVDKIREGGERWFRGLRGRRVLETWAGLRPCLPDGLPAIGRLDGVVVATGHAMKGVALSPITGRLVAQLVAGEATDHDLTPFRPDRFSA
jgi:D-amino-acid dehydrogenase